MDEDDGEGSSMQYGNDRACYDSCSGWWVSPPLQLSAEGPSSTCKRGKAGKVGGEIFSSKRLHLSYFLPSPAINLKGDITAN